MRWTTPKLVPRRPAVACRAAGRPRPRHSHTVWRPERAGAGRSRPRTDAIGDARTPRTGHRCFAHPGRPAAAHRPRPRSRLSLSLSLVPTTVNIAMLRPAASRLNLCWRGYVVGRETRSERAAHSPRACAEKPHAARNVAETGGASQSSAISSVSSPSAGGGRLRPSSSAGSHRGNASRG
jgi:hypothetical protein